MEQAKFYLQEILFVIFYKIHVVIVIPCLVIFLALIYVFSAKPLYTTSSSILLKPFFDSRDLLAQGGFLSVSPVTQIDINTEIEILTSKDLALEVGKELGIKPSGDKKDSLKVRLGISAKSTPEDEIISDITEELDIYSVIMSSVIRVQKTGRDPQHITNIVNMYVEKYIEKHINIHGSSRKKEISLYKQDGERKKKALDDKRSEMKNFIEDNKIFHLYSQKQNNIILEKELHSELIKIENDIARKKMSIERVRNKNKEAMIEEFRNNQFFSIIKLSYIPLLQERDKIVSLYNENSIEHKSIMEKISNFEKELKIEKERIMDGFEIEIEILAAQKKHIENKIDYLNDESLRLSRLEVEYNKYEEEIKRLSDIYDLYVKKIEEMEIQEGEAEGENLKLINSKVSIISKAYPPSKPVLPKRTLILAVSVVAGFLAGLGAGFASYYFDHTVKSSNDIEKLTKSPVISLLESVHEKKKY